MREIKFRVWDSDIQKMQYNAGLSITKGNVISFDLNTPMQFTGLRDKSGKEIYEGDIIKEAETSHGVSGVVEYLAPKFKVAYTYEDSKSFSINNKGDCVYDKVTEYISLQKGWWEVIGNIYENPELLEKQ